MRAGAAASSLEYCLFFYFSQTLLYSNFVIGRAYHVICSYVRSRPGIRSLLCIFIRKKKSEIGTRPINDLKITGQNQEDSKRGKGRSSEIRAKLNNLFFIAEINQSLYKVAVQCWWLHLGDVYASILNRLGFRRMNFIVFEPEDNFIHHFSWKDKCLQTNINAK